MKIGRFITPKIKKIVIIVEIAALLATVGELLINNVFFDLYNKRKELCLMKSDITNILKICNYFSRSA